MEIHVNCNMSFNFSSVHPPRTPLPLSGNYVAVARFPVSISIARLLTFAPH